MRVEDVIFASHNSRGAGGEQVLKNVDIVRDIFHLNTFVKMLSEARKHTDENSSNHTDAGENSLSPPTIAQAAPSQQNVSSN